MMAIKSTTTKCQRAILVATVANDCTTTATPITRDIATYVCAFVVECLNGCWIDTVDCSSGTTSRVDSNAEQRAGCAVCWRARTHSIGSEIFGRRCVCVAGHGWLAAVFHAISRILCGWYCELESVSHLFAGAMLPELTTEQLEQYCGITNTFRKLLTRTSAR